MSEEEKKYKLQPLNETAYNTEDLMAIVKIGWDLSEHRPLRPEACIFRYYSPSKAAHRKTQQKLGQPALVKVSRYSERGLYDCRASLYSGHYAPAENEAGNFGVHFGLVEPKAQNFVGVNDLHLLLLSAGKAPPELVYQIACRAHCVHHMFARRAWQSASTPKTHFPDRYDRDDLMEKVAGLTLRVEPRRSFCDPGEVLLPAEAVAIKSLAIEHTQVRKKVSELEGVRSKLESNTRQVKRYKASAEKNKLDLSAQIKELRKAEKEFDALVKTQEKAVEKERKLRLRAANTWIKGGK